MKQFALNRIAVSRLAILGLLLIGMPLAQVLAQGKEVTTQRQVWVRYDNKVTFDDHWSLETEIEDRRFMFPDRQHQLLLPRMTLTRKLGHGWDAGGGFVYFEQSLPQDQDVPIEVVRPEIRPHVEFNYKQDAVGRFQVTHRYRLEERFARKLSGMNLADGYDFNFRFRYRIQAACPVVRTEGNAGSLTLKVYDELMINIGSKIVRNVFDHNRLGIGFSYGIGRNLQVQPEFLNWFQQRNTGDEFYSRWIARLTVYHTIDLSR